MRRYPPLVVIAWSYLFALPTLPLFLAAAPMAPADASSAGVWWSLAYVLKSATGVFNGLSPAAAGDVFGSFLGRPSETAFWHGVFMAITVFIVSRGINSGIEKAMKIAKR